MTTNWTRLRAVAAAFLDRIWPPSGAHHAMPEDTEAPSAADPPRPPLGAAVSPAMLTMADLTPIRTRPYIPQQREERHHG